MEKWFSERIIAWYRQNKRDLPWRNEKDPYKIWLSEIILQQTQVKQGLSYYHKFTRNYPSVKQLAKAREDKILKDWQGLGYYSRARNLHAAAKAVVKEHKGIFPAEYSQIRQLKGVGDYTAAAIASFAYNQPYAVVDGNVYRVLSRLFGIADGIDTSKGKKIFQDLATNLLDKKNAGLHNQAIMEFGSQFCRPQNPGCKDCPFREKCFAYSHEKINAFPVKEKKTKVLNRYLDYIVIADKDSNILVRKRTGNDIWKGLYEFILVESENQLEPQELMAGKEFRKLTGKGSKIVLITGTYKHVLTHRNLFARFFVVKLKTGHNSESLNCKVNSLTKFAFPRLIEKFLNDCNLPELL